MRKPGNARPKPNSETSPPVEFEKGVSFPLSYQEDLVQRLHRHFSIPAHVRDSKTCYIRFKIRKDGSIFDIQVLASTGVDNLDKIAKKAVRDTARLQPISDYTNRTHVTVTVPFQFGSE